MAKIAKWLRKARKKEKIKSKKIKKRKSYVRGEVSFPIYIFDSSQTKIGKLKSLIEIRTKGLDLGAILLSIRDGDMHRGLSYSYNKSIKE